MGPYIAANRQAFPAAGVDRRPAGFHTVNPRARRTAPLARAEALGFPADRHPA